jgi:hypothetical protein
MITKPSLEYKSKIESLAPCKELLFDGTPGFGRYASLLSHAVGHPAKMNTRLTEYLILELTKPGELVLDPFVGSGTSCLAAKMLGRNYVGVELVKDYFEIACARVDNHKTLFEFSSSVNPLKIES